MAVVQNIADKPIVTEVLCLSASESQVTSPCGGVGVIVINYNTSRQTLRCLDSIQKSSELPDWVLVLDNASSADDYQYLLQGVQPPRIGSLCVYRSENNLGFSQGCNVLIKLLLSQPACRFIMLLNNDAVAENEMLASLSSALKEAGDSVGMVGGRMHKLVDSTQVDTLGISIYASLMPADRKTVDDIFLGPTGGCCMLTRELVERLNSVSGYCFDPRYFCYCEDTDLVLRAVLLGYRPLYLDRLLALHEGQASSGGGYNAFIAYHGLRNALWMQVKLMPAGLLWRYGFLLLFAHGLMIARHTMSGRFLLIFQVYRDALLRFPEFWAERKQFQEHTQLVQVELNRYVTRCFYRKGYLQSVLQEYSIFKFFSTKSSV